MCEAAASCTTCKHNIEDPRNTVLIIGYQAPETLGRRLVERRPEVRILDATCTLRAEVVVMNGFSSHADRDDLLAMLTPLADPKREAAPGAWRAGSGRGAADDAEEARLRGCRLSAARDECGSRLKTALARYVFVGLFAAVVEQGGFKAGRVRRST